MGYNGHETRCGCTSCGAERAIRVASSRRSRERAKTGNFAHRDVPALAAHVRALRAAGCRRPWIAAAAGVGEGVITAVLNGHQKATTPATAEALLAVTITDAISCAASAERAVLPALGTQRRLQALAAIGHPIYAVATQAGVNTDVAGRITRGSQTSVTADTYRKIVAVYSHLWESAGPSAVTRARALKKGWPSPLAWDDNIDDPQAVPETGKKTSRTAAIVEDADELRRAGEGWGAIESKVGVSLQRVEMARQRLRRTTGAAA